MKTFARTILFLLIGMALNVPAAMAGPAADKLGNCLGENTTGKDRKDMARWIFAMMSVHPDMQDLSDVTVQKRDQLDKTMAALVTKLLTENCKSEAKLAIDTEGATAFESSFRQVGVLAMKEIMSNPDVNSSLSNYAKYLDKNKFDKAFAKK